MTRRPKALVIAMAFVLIAVTGEQVHARQNESYLNHHSVGASVYAPVYQVKKHPGRYVKVKKGRKVIGPSARKRSLTAAGRNAIMTGDRSIPALAHRPSPQIMPHPAGCPPRRFCGCGTAQYLLGRTVTRGGLAVAANWLRFPRAHPGPGMAAARRGHVFAIVRYLGGNMVLAYDPNSGKGRTRIHVRPLTGFTVVNPHGWRTASR